jgi:outer membrane beta-barrel protein
MIVVKRHVAGLLILLGALLASGPVLANALADAPPVLHQRLLREGRIEMGPRIGVTLNDPYERHILPGLTFNYFFLDWMGVGLDLQYGVSVDTSLHRQVDASLQEKWEVLCPIGAPNQAACEEKAGLVPGRPGIGTSSVEVLATANISIVPVIGKAMIFGQLMRYDLHLLFGAGVATLRAEGERSHVDDDLSLVPLAGIGFRLFFNDWISMNLEARDLLMSYHRVTDQDGSKLDAEFTNHFELSWSLGFVLPQVPMITSLGE